jgi:hypothetical protein
VSHMVRELEATEEPQLAALQFGVTSIQPVRLKATLHDVTSKEDCTLIELG